MPPRQLAHPTEEMELRLSRVYPKAAPALLNAGWLYSLA